MGTIQSVNSLSRQASKNVEPAFEEVFRSYYAPLCYFAERMLVNKADAEDVVSALFGRIWDRNEVFDGPEHTRAFLYRATQNACLDFLKSTKRTGERHKNVLAQTIVEEESFLEEMLKTEVWAEIYRAINRLPSQCARVIRLGYLEGLKNEEIAERLGVSLQAVKNYKRRGLNRLKDLLSPKQFLLLLLLGI